MECPSCQHENPPQSKFCFECGAGLELTCPKCGISLPTGVKFCNGCGHDLSQPATPSDTPTKPAEPSAPTGERRRATVLFSDLSGFTAMTEKLDPEEVQGLMRRLKDRAVEIVEAHGGIVSQFVGDEVLALFGIPTAHEDDPVRAVKTARQIHALAHELSSEVEEEIGLPLRMHTGIHTGLVVTSTADDRDGRIGVTGDTVNTAARLKATAESDAVLLSPVTQHLVEEYFETEPQTPLTLKGKSKPITPHRVVRETAVQTRFEAAQQRGFTPHTGRESELAQLQRCLDISTAGEGQFVSVVGEAGIGKSRLLYEFRHTIDRDQVTVLEGRCQSYGAYTPYLPLLDAMRRGLQLSDQDSAKELHRKVISNIRAIDPALEEFIPHFLHLLSIPSEDFPLPSNLQGEAMRRAFEEAFAALYSLNAKLKPMVAIFEDWHWVDEPSNSALKYLLGLIGQYPLMVVVLYRPDYTASWGNPGNHTPLVLKSLETAQTERILGGVLDSERLPEGFGKLIHERTGGNPFFIEEMGRTLLEDGTVRADEGQAELTRALDESTLPDTVETVIRARLDRLDGDAQEALRVASVIGREFARRLLEEVSSARDTLGASLDDLRALELIQQIRVLPEAAYMFKHVLSQVVVYETLLHQRRRELHGLVARAVEALYADRLEEHYEALAYHFGQSEEIGKAIDYLEKAGDKAAGYYSLEEARKHYESAIGLLDGLDMSNEQKRKRIDINLKWAAAAFYTANEKQLETLKTALAYAEELKDGTRVLKTTNVIGRTYNSTGNIGLAMDEFEKCIAMAKALEDDELLGLPYNIIGRSCLWVGEYLKGIDYLRKGIPMMERQGDPGEVAWSRSMLGLTLGWVGEFQEAQSLTETALETTRGIGNPTAESAALVRLAHVQVLRGMWDDAIASSSEAIDISQRVGNQIVAGLAMCDRGYSTFFAGRQKEGISEIQKGIQTVQSTGSHFTLSLKYAWLAEIQALAGRGEEGSESGRKALEVLQFGEKWGEVAAHRALAMAAAHTSPLDWERCDSHITESRRLARERSARPDMALTHLRYAEILHKKGDLDAAREQLDQATALFGEMEMTWWLEQAEALEKTLEAG